MVNTVVHSYQVLVNGSTRHGGVVALGQRRRGKLTPPQIQSQTFDKGADACLTNDEQHNAEHRFEQVQQAQQEVCLMLQDKLVAQKADYALEFQR